MIREKTQIIRDKGQIGFILTAGTVAFLLIWAYMIDPLAGGYTIPCPFHEMTGLYCPGCGLQRATYHMLHGEMEAALNVNVLSVLLVPLFLYFLYSWFRSLDEKDSRQRDLPFPVIAIGVSVIFLFWILRNIPSWPFSYLAP